MRKLIVLLLLCLMSYVPSKWEVSAQDADVQWVYVLTQTDASYELIKINTETRIAESIYSINKTTQQKLGDFIPASELEAAKVYRRLRNEDDSRIATQLKEMKPQISVKLLGVSSDEQAVAIGVIYEYCVDRSDAPACFGVTQIVIVVSDARHHVAWTVAHHATEYRPENCAGIVGFYQRIRDLRWTPDDTHLVIRFTAQRFCNTYDSLLVIVPREVGSPVIVLDAVRFWDFAGSSNRIVSITAKFEVAIDEFTATSHIRHVQSFHDIVIFDETYFNNIAYLGSEVLIFGGHPINAVDRLFTLDPANATLDFVSLGIGKIHGSFDGQTAIIAGQDDELYLAKLINGKLQLSMLLNDVKFWQQNASGDLLIQHTLQSSYSIVDLQGNMKSILYVTEEVADLEKRLGKILYQPALGQFEIMW